VDEVYKRFQAARVEVLSTLDPASARLALQRLIPHPVRQRYTAISLLPQPPLWHRAVMAAVHNPRTSSLLAATAVVAGIAAFACLREWRRGGRP
jgi:hypothetical protein